MVDIIIVMLPLLGLSIFYYGIRALLLCLISVVSSVVFEYLYRRLLKQSRSIGDFSAVITGIFIAFNVPVTAPLWMPIIGSFFAIVLVKQLFGGLGRNLFNPAAAGIAFLNISWQGIMSTFPMAMNWEPLSWVVPSDFETGRTVLACLKLRIVPDNQKFEILYGYTPGNLGTCCVIVILIAGAYLLYRRIISWQIPAAFLGVVVVAALLFPRCPTGSLDSVFYELTSGSLLFAAVFMATDPVTSPVTRAGRLLFGAGCGLITVLLRYFGAYPEGVYFAILIMNPFMLGLDRLAWRYRMKGGTLDVRKRTE